MAIPVSDKLFRYCSLRRGVPVTQRATSLRVLGESPRPATIRFASSTSLNKLYRLIDVY